MLYVSQIVDNKIGIFDTDDGSETFITRSQLFQTLRLGVDIQGAVVETIQLRGKPVTRLKSIEVQQNPDMLSSIQAKTRMLKGVNVVVQGDTISSIYWNDADVQDKTVIRLSQFGSKCADNIFIARSRRFNSNQVIFILDDKITIRRKTLQSADNGSVHIDIREVTSNRIADLVYKAWSGSRGKLSMWVTDNPDRFELMSAIVCVNTGYAPSCTCSEETVKTVEGMFFNEFETVSNSRFSYVSSLEAKEAVKNYVKRMRRFEDFWRGDSDDYSMALTYDRLDIFVVLMETTTASKLALHHFNSFMHNFTPSERVREVYVRLCKRANVWLMNLVREKNWRIERG